MEAHAKAVTKHQKRVVDLRARAVTSTAIAASAGALGLIDAATVATDNGVDPRCALVVAARVGAVRRPRRQRPPPLAHHHPARAAHDVGHHPRRRPAPRRHRLHRVAGPGRRTPTARHAWCPAVASLHPDAGKELKAADDEAAPAFTAQVARLAVLDQVRRELPGSTAATAATDAADQVRGRLAQGVAVYDRLLAAASTMLASPDLGRSGDDVLGPAADALTAYAEGLRTAAVAEPPHVTARYAPSRPCERGYVGSQVGGSPGRSRPGRPRGSTNRRSRRGRGRVTTPSSTTTPPRSGRPSTVRPVSAHPSPQLVEVAGLAAGRPHQHVGQAAPGRCVGEPTSSGSAKRATSMSAPASTAPALSATYVPPARTHGRPARPSPRGGTRSSSAQVPPPPTSSTSAPSKLRQGARAVKVCARCRRGRRRPARRATSAHPRRTARARGRTGQQTTRRPGRARGRG